MITRIGILPLFLAVRFGCALLLLRLSAGALPPAGFAVFSQLLAGMAVLNTLALGAIQNGVIRETAAAPSRPDEVQGAALAIWALIAPVLLVTALLAGRPLMQLLTGAPGHPLLPVLFAIAAVLGGPGQIWCSVLSGRGHTVLSLSAQAVGLVAGAALAAILIAGGQASWAALGFAGGPLLTTLVALGLLRQAGLAPCRPCLAWREIRQLLASSGAIVATTVFAAGVLFWLRADYRSQFGATLLSHWLAANRISDMSSQLIGLFMVQILVPQLAMTHDARARRALLLRGGGGTSVVMVAGLAVFVLAAPAVVGMLLSPAYLPAIPLITAYLAGDCARVWVALAINAQFAAGRPWRYAGIEIAMMAILAIMVETGIHTGRPGIVAWAYPVSCLITALACVPSLLTPRGATAASTVATA